MQIGELFILRINIHLQGSVLDAPELMWAEPQLEPVYQAVRAYLEMDQRVGLLQERVGVIADLLAVLKDQLGQTHGEWGLLFLFPLRLKGDIDLNAQASTSSGSSSCSSPPRSWSRQSISSSTCTLVWTERRAKQRPLGVYELRL